jgi:acyl dehydratase
MTTATKTQRYWEDVTVGDELPGLTFSLGWTKMAQQVSGSQDFYAVHHDPEFARAGGHRDIFYNTGFTRACLGRLLTDWIGDDGWLRKLRFEMRRMNMNGDTMSVKGKVVENREIADGDNELDIELWAENDREGITTPAFATVTLPSRG